MRRSATISDMKSKIVALIACCFCTAVQAQVVPSIRISGDGSYLIDALGQPVFLNGDTAWSLMVEPTDAQIQTYFDNRQAKGYNALIASLIEHAFATNAPANVYGDQPFTGAAFSTPNESYFARIDDILDQAAQRGITIFLAPIYLGWQCGDQGWCGEVQSASSQTMRDYGRYLGQRYRDFANIVWLIGGDTNPFDYNVQGKLGELIAGIEEFDPDHLMTAHNGPEESSQDVWGSASWLDLNGVYTYNATYVETRQQYDRANALPLFFMESAYENEHGSTSQSLRAQAYQSVLWGARLGHFFGNCPIWPFGAPSASSFCSGSNWLNQLDSSGSVTVAYIGDLMRGRRHWLMEPDHGNNVMTAGYGSGSSRAVTARATDGSSVIAYVPTQRQVTIDLGQVSGSGARAWWWNPRTNAATDLGTYPASGTQSFTSPSGGDWVLLIDNADVPFLPPGSGSPTVPKPPTLLSVQ
jgi:hypothetical protein